jgi:plastocyanin
LRRSRIAWLVVVGVAALAIVAAACGGSNGGEETAAETPTALATAAPSPTQEAEATPTTAAPVEEPTAAPTEEIVPTAEPTEEPAPTAVPTSQPAATEEPAASTQTLDIAMVPGIRFDKDTLTAQSGATVTINVTNQDEGVPHSFSVYTDSSAAQPLAEGSVGDVCTGPCSYSLTFVAPEPGVYFFRCDVHPTQMNGTFIVE